MILYSDKCHYMCLRKDAVSDLLQLSKEEVKESEPETVLGIEIYNKLTFESHIKTLRSKASQKLGALQRISNLLGTQKKTLLFNIITKSQSSCCPLVWMFCSRRSNSLINNVHEGPLRVNHDNHDILNLCWPRANYCSSA